MSTVQQGRIRPRTLTKHRYIVPVLMLGAFVLSACAGAAFRSATSWPGLSTDGDTVYMAFNQAVYAIDAGNGNLQWTYPAEPENSRTFYAPPTVSDNGTLYVGDFLNGIVALNATTGAVEWGPITLGQDNGRIVGAPTIAGDLLLIPSGDGRLYARFLEDGAAVWAYPSEFAEPLDEAIWSSPVVEDERVFFAGMDHNIYAVDLAQGGQVWAAIRNSGGAIADSPVIADSKLLVGTFAHQLIALDGDRGSEAWIFDAGNWIWGSPVVEDGVAYFGDLAGLFHAVDIRNGSELWNEALADRISASPALSEDRLFVAAESGTLYVRELSTNRDLWSVAMDAELHTQPLVVGDTVVVATNGGDPLVCAFDVETGNERWSFTPGGSDKRCRTG